MRRAAYVVIVVFLASVTAHAQSIATFPRDRRLLIDLEEAIAQSEAQIRAVNIRKLPLTYEEGEILAERKELCLKQIERVRALVVAARDGALLSTNLRLLLQIKDFDFDLDSLVTGLANPITYSDRDAVAKALDWAKKLMHQRRALQPHLQHYFRQWTRAFTKLR